MAQPQVGYQWTSIGTVGTVTLKSTTATLVRVFIPGTYVGTVIFHDAASTAGTTATSAIGTFGLPATTVPGNIDIQATCKNGLTYQATGTPTLTVIWD